MPDVQTTYTRPQALQRDFTARAVPTRGTRDYATAGIMIAGTLLNAVLAIINAWVFPASVGLLIAIQAVVTVTALLLALRRATVALVPLASFTAALIVFMLFGALNHGVSVRDANDILLIPVFLAVGVTARAFPKKAFLYLYSLVWASVVLEAVSAISYKAIFSPLSYFSNTRAWVAGQVDKAATEQGLYLGAQRGGGLILSFISDHRIGGLFLEPLSLSYFAVVSAMVWATLYRGQEIRLGTMMVLCLILALVSDSRLGTGLIVVFWGASFLPSALLPKTLAYVVPFIILFAAFIIFSLGLGGGSGDTMVRLAITISEASTSPFAEVVLGNVETARFNDSGVLRIVYNTTLIGGILALVLYSGVVAGRFRGYAYVPTLAAIYITSSALFGGAFLSIKTVAIFGIFVGTAATGRFENVEPVGQPTDNAAGAAPNDGERPVRAD